MHAFSIVIQPVLLQHGYTDLHISNPFPNDKILDSSKLKQFADDNYKFDENDRKFDKHVENTKGKGEIARNEQFLLLPQCFQKTCIGQGLTHYHAIPHFDALMIYRCGKYCEKRRICLLQAISHFLTMFFYPA